VLLAPITSFAPSGAPCQMLNIEWNTTIELNNVMLLYVTKTYAMANHMDAIVSLDVKKKFTY
jgi:hypothetical protein